MINAQKALPAIWERAGPATPSWPMTGVAIIRARTSRLFPNSAEHGPLCQLPLQQEPCRFCNSVAVSDHSVQLLRLPVVAQVPLVGSYSSALGEEEGLCYQLPLQQEPCRFLASVAVCQKRASVEAACGGPNTDHRWSSSVLAEDLGSAINSPCNQDHAVFQQRRPVTTPVQCRFLWQTRSHSPDRTVRCSQNLCQRYHFPL